jgi:integrase
MRPIEIRSAPWSAFNGTTLTIGRSRTKGTARRTRTILVPEVTARELRAWKLASGGRGDEPIVGAMTPNALRLWGAKPLRRAISVATAGRIEDAHRLHLRTYAHVIDSISGERYADLDALIVAARATLVFPGGSLAAGRGR